MMQLRVEAIILLFLMPIFGRSSCEKICMGRLPRGGGGGERELRPLDTTDVMYISARVIFGTPTCAIIHATTTTTTITATTNIKPYHNKLMTGWTAIHR